MRIEVNKTYKLFIGGKFPRSESGRSYQPAGAPQRNVARGSRKDLREAVVCARAAQSGWQARTGYNRGQILYRIAEIIETRKESLAGEIAACSEVDHDAACAEVEAAVDLVTWYAGLPDKLQSLLGSQNEVSGPFFNFSAIEPTGVCGVVAPSLPSLLGLLGCVLPIVCSGNTVVVLCSEAAPLPGLALGEILAVSDVPGGVINLLAGQRDELVPQLASHRDVDAILVAGPLDESVGQAAADSVTRVRFAELDEAAWRDPSQLRQLAWVEPFVELKTFWHPVAE